MTDVCECASRPGYTRDLTMSMEFWLCSKCRLPAKAYLESVLARLEEPDTQD